jgi:hypothetical protein
VGGFLEKTAWRAPQRQSEADPSRHDQPQWPHGLGEIRFEPARWLMWLLAIASLLLRGGRISKLGVAGLIWSVAPRKMKVAAAGFALAATIVLAGAIAAITLLALQLG